MTANDPFRLEGKLALVTGSSRGLGRSMALALAKAGADIILTGRTVDTLEKSRKEIEGIGRRAYCIAIDMSTPEVCEAGFKECLKVAGSIDILINNLGNRLTSDPVVSQSLSGWRNTVDLNVTSCFLGTKIIGGAMVERGKGGRVINISSINAFVSNKGIGDRAYEASKAAVLQFTRAVAADWAPHGVTVNAICPGLFMTDANMEWNVKKPEVIDALVAGIPMGRPGSPDEIGPLAVFLAGSGSSFMTGAAIVVDGGYSLW